jgi:hypothetical protein
VDNLINRRFSLSMLKASAVRLNATTYKSEKRGAASLRGNISQLIGRFFAQLLAEV